MFTTTDFSRSLVASLGSIAVAVTCLIAAVGPAMTTLAA